MDKILDFFNKDYIKKLDMLNLQINAKLSGGFSGSRKAIGKGSSLEFSDFRNYTEGDDLRRLDWNSYARFGNMFIKVFTEEKQADISVFLDTSKSMDYGGRNKAFFAKVLTASIGYIALKNSDRFNVFCFNENMTIKKDKINSSRQFFEVLKFLDALEFGGGTNIGGSLEKAGKLRFNSGISIIISDFFADDFLRYVSILNEKRQRVMLFHVLSEEEINPVHEGRLKLIDSETGETREVIVNERIIDDYKKSLENMKKEIRAFCTARGYVYAVSSSSEEPLDMVASTKRFTGI